MRESPTRNIDPPIADLQSAAVLAATLERLERAPRAPDADQYRIVVERLQTQLRALDGEPGLRALLGRFPAAAEIYENLQYAHAGLCLQSLDRSLAAESKAREVLARATRAD